MAITTLTLTVHINGATLDEVRDHMKYISEDLEAMFEEGPHQCATITDIKISDDSKPRTFVSKLAE